MVNFGPLAAEIVSSVWGTQANFNGFRVLTALLNGTERQPNFAALNRWRHLYSAGRPSRWAFSHILVHVYSADVDADTATDTLHGPRDECQRVTESAQLSGRGEVGSCCGNHGTQRRRSLWVRGTRPQYLDRERLSLSGFCPWTPLG